LAEGGGGEKKERCLSNGEGIVLNPGQKGFVPEGKRNLQQGREGKYTDRRGGDKKLRLRVERGGK